MNIEKFKIIKTSKKLLKKEKESEAELKEKEFLDSLSYLTEEGVFRKFNKHNLIELIEIPHSDNKLNAFYYNNLRVFIGLAEDKHLYVLARRVNEEQFFFRFKTFTGWSIGIIALLIYVFLFALSYA